MKKVKCIAESPVNVPIPGGRIDFFPDEEKEIPDEIADKLDSKHFEVEGRGSEIPFENNAVVTSTWLEKQKKKGRKKGKED